MEVIVGGQKINFKSKRVQGLGVLFAVWVLQLVNNTAMNNGVPEIVSHDVLSKLGEFGQLWFYGGVAHAVTKKG